MANICGMKYRKELNCWETDLDTCVIPCNGMYEAVHLMVPITASSPCLYYGLGNLTISLVEEEEGDLHERIRL